MCRSIMPDKLDVLLPIRQSQRPLQLQTHAQALESNSSQCVFGGETLRGFVSVSPGSEGLSGSTAKTMRLR